MKRKQHPHQAGLILAIIFGSYMCQGDQCILQPDIPLIADTFPQYSYAAITAIQTVSALTLGLAALVSGYLVKIMGKKKLLLAGSACFILAGTLTGLAPSYVLVLLCRIIEGAGAGIVVSLSMMLIPDFFSDQNQQNKIIGLNAVATALCGTFLGVISGYLGTFSWRYSVMLYLVGIVVLIFQAVFIPKDSTDAGNTEAEAAVPVSPGKITRSAVSVGVMAFLFAVISTIYMVSIAAFITENNLGDSSQAGITISVMTIGTFTAGVLFARLFDRLNKFLPAVCYVFMVAGVALPLIFPRLSVVLISTVIFGGGYGLYFPYINARAMEVSSPENKDKNVSFINGCYYIGMFVSSMLIGVINRLFNDSSAVFNFRFMCVAFSVLIVFYVIMAVRSRLSRPRSLNEDEIPLNEVVREPEPDHI